MTTQSQPDRGPKPVFTPEHAAALASEHFDFAGQATPLPGERDQNFLIRSGDATAVLKISNVTESEAFLDCQNEAIERLVREKLPYRFPRPLPTRGGSLIERVSGDGGAEHLVRLVAWVPGVMLRDVRPHAPALVEQIGALFGHVRATLDDWDPPAARRPLVWDLQGAPGVIRRGLDAVTDPDQRGLVERVLEDFEERVAPRVDELRTGVIHGDGNDWNVVISGHDEPGGAPRVSGLLDFGDLVRSWIAAEPAIAAAYAMLGKRDPLRAAAAVARGFHGVAPLEEAEVEALYPLIRLRLALSVVMSALRGVGADDYLSVSEADAWALLAWLDQLHPRFATYVLRDACGLDPVPAERTVTTWLGAHRHELGPVLDPDPVEVRTTVLDLGQESPLLLDLLGRSDAAAWTEVIERALREAGADVGVGPYLEVRPWYEGEAFDVETEEGPERRTVHLGLDLFAPEGTPVLAPLDGVVVAARINEGRLGYGPTVTLRHDVATSGGEPLAFWTLYGHLDGASIESIRSGDRVARGDRIARIGSFPENGGWAPHLHLQLIVDPLDAEENFPGVARPSTLSVWKALSPDPGPLCPVAGAGPVPAPMRDEEIVVRRNEHIGRMLSVSYGTPIQIVRGSMQYLFDTRGQPYLDCVNNVAHVGHAHPRVVDALARQAAVLNTNTRYLHEGLVEYAERLTATLPDPLSVCFFVCSGSEANELALRLARTHTGRHDVVVLDGAYHGHTGQLVAMSPYKTRGKGGTGGPAWVHEAALPDPYRGAYRGDGPEVADGYALSVADALARAAGRRDWSAADDQAVPGVAPDAVDDDSGGSAGASEAPLGESGGGSDRADAVLDDFQGGASDEAAGAGAAAFFVEPLPSCGGQIVPPDGYLKEAFRYAREAGALCVADEVQIGFGRVGSHFWGFQTHGVVPDIVTMGKPIGNGHPIGAVVTTPEVAASFDTGMEYFSTFGGNTVSCAVGLAVLDVIEHDGLQAHAAEVGAYLLDGLRELSDRHPIIGDVRGRGLFVGIELVLDRDTRAPAPAHAGHVIERLRGHGILLSTDGPDRNVLKFKPPLPFDRSDADRLVRTLDRVLSESALRIG